MLYRHLKSQSNYNTLLCNTGQHLEMLENLFPLFDVKPDITLEAMTHNRSLDQMCAYLLNELGRVVELNGPDLIIVQGDTLSSYVAALVGFHQQIPVAHVEAGLRTHNKFSPFPEEMYRVMIDQMASLHFPPTALAKQNLNNCVDDINTIDIVGNTGIDALKFVQLGIENKAINFVDLAQIDRIKRLKTKVDQLILLTLHRREIHGQQMQSLLEAVNALVSNYNIGVVFPMHKHPKVRAVINAAFSENDKIELLEPMAYQDFIYAMTQADLIISDSGGVQEEAPSLGKRVLVVRKETERPEAIGGINLLVGTDPDQLIEIIKAHLSDADIEPTDIYGDGNASLRIAEKIDQFLNKEV